MTLKIEVSGPRASGKTTLLMIIHNVLKDIGWQSEYSCTCDGKLYTYGSVPTLFEHFADNLDYSKLSPKTVTLIEAVKSENLKVDEPSETNT